MTWARAVADAAITLGGRNLRPLADRPAHDQEEPDDRDLQDEHQPDEGPGIHATSDRTTDRGLLVTTEG
jgi:hypothetical protein